MQRDELSLSRQELALTRQELKETKEETSLSRQALEAQVNHIQYEAKLSELTRLLERSQTKYESLLHVSFPESHVVPEQGSFNLDNTYASFLKSLCESYDTQIAKAIAEEVTKNAQVSLHLIKLRKEAILFSDLALAYYSNSQSPEFARAYLSDALLYLMDINRLKVGESIQNRIEKIDLILDGIIQDEAQLL
ncbi:hypothetical protein [Shewanella algae]|nr:hypothetical protein [Shewanella algae]MBO2670025.1 hypothetical protein [Shewanella algae]